MLLFLLPLVLLSVPQDAPPEGSVLGTGTYVGDLGQIALEVHAGRVLGRYVRGGGCAFDPGRPVLDGVLEGQVFVGTVAVCQTGPACDERAYPVMAFYEAQGGTLVGDVKLEESCDSPGLRRSRLVLKRVPGEFVQAPPKPDAGLGKVSSPDCMNAFDRGQHLLQRVDWAGAAYYFEQSLRCSQQFWPAHLGLGVAELRRGNVDLAVSSMEKARDLARDLHQEDAGVFYDLACAKARQRDLSAALFNLRRAIELGWSDPLAMNQDPDLASVRAEGEFKALVDRAWDAKDRKQKEKSRRADAP